MRPQHTVDRRIDQAGAALVLIIVSGVAAASLGDYVVWTDATQIAGGSRVATGLARFLAEWRHVSELNFYRPLLTASFTLDALLWGRNWLGFHVTNVLLHGLVAALLYLVARDLLRRLGSPRPVLLAALAAILWGIHPTKAESVAWLAGRSDLLLCLPLAGMWLSLRALDHDSPPVRASTCAAIGLLFAAGLLAKETAIVVPALLAWSYLVALRAGREAGGRAPRRTEIMLAVAWGAVAALYLLVRALWLWQPVAFEVHQPFITRALTQVVVVVDYLATLLWPPRATTCDVVPLHAGLDGAVLAAGGLLAAAVILAVVLFRRRRALWFVWGLGWFLIGLAPVANLLQQEHFRADRYLYLPSFGVILALVLFLDAGLARIRRPAVRAAVFALLAAGLVALAVTSVVRYGSWRDEEAFFRAEVERHPDYREGLLILCALRADRGDAAGVLDLCRRGVDVDRRRFAASVRFDWAFYRRMFIALQQMGAADSAEQLAREAIDRHPRDPTYQEVLANIQRSMEAP